MNDSIRKLFKPPFKLCFMKQYVYDSDNNTVADFRNDGDSFRVRGWGRMKYMPNADKAMDELEAFLYGLTTDVRTDKDACVDRLNKAWE